jgi:uncharacterized protein YukE
MAIQHMDTDACRATQANIVSTKDQLQQQLNALGSAVDALVVSNWIAPGATMFQNEFHNWRSSMTATVDQLNDFASRLQNEIAEWEAHGAQA